MKLNQRKVTAALKKNGFKLTPQRRAIIAAIAGHKDHLTPAAIFERVRQEYPELGLVTVYRTLEILNRLNLICELHTNGESCPSYTLGAPEHHHHLVCDSCGKVLDFPGCDTLSALEQKLAQATKFKIKNHILEFSGLCYECQQERI